MSLFEKFTSNCYEKFYYGNISYDPIRNPDDSWNFIEEYFKLGKKEGAFDLAFIDSLRIEGKHIHSISMYFLGCVLSDIVKEQLSDTLIALIPHFSRSFKYKFNYSWFLTCLYHDSTYVVEEKREVNSVLGDSRYFLNEYLKQYDVTYNVYSHKWIKGRHYTYSKSIVEKYFYYCLAHRRKVDHGIMGGFILFDRLKKNYNRKWKEFNDYGMGRGTYESFNYMNLSWKIEHLDHFAYIANAIIAHNIWYNRDRELYRRYGLDGLIICERKKIKIEDDPLLFFLAILDTIEPTKFYYIVEPQYIWRNIDINYSHSEKEISIELLDQILDYKSWANKIKSLESWIDVEVIDYPIERRIAILIKYEQ